MDLGLQDKAVIVTGDFNCGEQSPAVRFLRGEIASAVDPESPVPAAPQWTGLTDAYVQTHPAEPPESSAAGTFHGFRGTPDGRRIDYVLVAPARRGRVAARFPTAEVRTASIDRSNDNGRWPSDHFPVVATVRFMD